MIKQFLKKLFPSALVDWVPGAKIIAGALAYGVAALAQSFGVDLGVIGLSSEEVQSLIPLVAAFMWPSNNMPPVTLEQLAAALQRAITGKQHVRSVSKDGARLR